MNGACVIKYHWSSGPAAGRGLTLRLSVCASTRETYKPILFCSKATSEPTWRHIRLCSSDNADNDNGIPWLWVRVLLDWVELVKTSIQLVIMEFSGPSKTVASIYLSVFTSYFRPALSFAFVRTIVMPAVSYVRTRTVDSRSTLPFLV